MKIEIFKSQLTNLKGDNIKDFYRLSTGLLAPKFLANHSDIDIDSKENSSKFEKMRQKNVADQMLESTLL